MNTSIVKVTGNLTTDPELRFTSGDSKAVTDVKVAVNLRAKTDQGEWLDAGTQYYTAPVWGREAENVAELRKGDRVHVIGELQYRAWVDNDGAPHFERIIRNATVAPSLEYATVQITRNPKSANSESA